MSVSDRSPAVGLHPEIRRALARFRWASLALRALSTIGSVSITAGLVFSLAILIDRVFLLSDPLRIAVTSSAIVAVTIVTLWMLSGLFRSLGRLSVASAMERLAPRLDESLISTVELTRNPSPADQRMSTDLLGALQDSTAERLRELRPAARLRTKPALLRLVGGVSVWIGIVGLFALFPESLEQLTRRFLHPRSALPRPSTVELAIRPGNAVLATGTELIITAELRRGASSHGVLTWRRAGEAEAKQETLPFRAQDKTTTLERSFPPLERRLEYRVSAGDYQSPWFHIDVRDPPEPRRFTLTYGYPEYTHRPEVTQRARHGVIKTLEGTRVSIELEASEPLSEASIRLLERPDSGRGTQEPPAVLPMEVEGRTARLEGLIARRNLMGYTLRLEGRDGVHNDGRLRYPIEVRPDSAPTVEIVQPRSAEISAEPTSLVGVTYRVHDDVGIARIVLEFDPEAGLPVAGAHRRTLYPLPPPTPGSSEMGTEAPRRSIETTYQLDVASLGLQPGAVVPFVLEVTDLAGQVARTGPRQLRAVLNPLYPEGPEWPTRLRELENELRSGLADWESLGPFAAREGTHEVDTATLESLETRAAIAIDLLTRLRRVADRMTEVARSIAIASAQRRTLELLARHLRTEGLTSGTDLWTAAHEVLAHSRRPGSATTTHRDAWSELEKLYRRTGSILETSWIDLRAMLRSEAIEDATERTRALASEQKNIAGSDPSPEVAARRLARQKSILRRATQIGATLTSLSQSRGQTDARLETLSRGYLQNTVVPLDAVRRALDREPEADVGAAVATALSRLTWAVQDLGEARRRLKSQIDAARQRFESLDPVGDGLDDLYGRLKQASETDRGSVEAEALGLILLALDDATLQVDEELAMVENMAYADLETVTDLSSILKILEETRRDILLSGRTDFFPEEDSELLLSQGTGPGPGESMALSEFIAVRDRVEKVRSAYRVTAPSRRIGLAIQTLDQVATSGEELISRLRRTEPWKLREVRFHARAQEEILGALLDATKGLTGLLDGTAPAPTKPPAFTRGLTSALTLLDSAAGHLRGAVDRIAGARAMPAAPVESGDRGAAGVAKEEDPDVRLVESRGEVRSAVLAVDQAIVQLEDLRDVLSDDPTGAAAARRWLRDQRGALAARVRRLADREDEHAQRVKSAGSEFKKDGARPGSHLLIEHEELRREARELAEQARRESDAALGGAAGVERSRRYDRAAARLAAIAEGEMLRASRAMRRAEEAPDDRVEGLHLEAFRMESEAAERLRALAEALGTLESDDALEELGGELDELLALAAEDEAGRQRTIEEIVSEARLLLEKTEAATATLAGRLDGAPRYRPVLDALREATEHLRQAVAAANEGARQRAEESLDRGRETLMKAAALARELRGDQQELVQDASESLAPASDASGQEKTTSKEMDALRKEVETLLAELQAARARAREIDALFRDIVGSEDNTTEEIDPEASRELMEREERLLEEFNERFMTLDQLVDLVAKLLQIEQETTTLGVLQSKLGDSVLELSDRSGNHLGRLEEIAGEQTRLTTIGEQLTDRFTKAGFRLTASLPQVMAAYWKGGDAAARVAETQTAARIELDKAVVRGALAETEAHATAEYLFEAGRAVGAFLTRLRETRELALRAITEQESGIDESSLGQRQIEASRSSLSEAMEMMRQGRMKEARAAHRQSMRSLAQATQAIRKGSNADLLAELTGEGAGGGGDAEGDFAWRVLTRGDESLEELKFTRDNVVELPYPTQFRDLVRAYLKALATRGF